MKPITFRSGLASFQARAAPKFKSVNKSSQRWTILAVADLGLSSMSAVLPACRSFLDECGKALGGVPRRHQLGQIDLLDRGEFRGDPLDRAVPGGAGGKAQRCGALGRQIPIEIAERGGFGIVGNLCHKADLESFLGTDRASGKQEVLGGRKSNAFGEQTGGRRREDADLNLGLTEFGIPPGKQQMSSARKLKAAAETLAADRHQDRRGRSKDFQDQLMEAREHRRAAVRQMLLDRGTKAEMGAGRVDQNAAQSSIGDMLAERLLDRADHRRVKDIRLGAIEPQTKQVPVAFKPDLQRIAHALCPPAFDAPACGIKSSIIASVHPSPLARRWRSATKSISRSFFGPSLKARNPVRASAIMLRASQARLFSLLRFQASSFGLRSSSKLLVRHSGNVVISLVHIASTLASSSDRSTVPRATTALPAARAAPVRGSPWTMRPYSSR